MLNKTSHKLFNIPKISEGYVPHFMFSGQGKEIQIATIEASMFMKPDKFVDNLFKGKI